jgi:hypothetical protein
MNIDANISTIFSVLAQINASLLAVTVTLVVIIPTLVEIVRIKSSSFLSGETGRRRLVRGMAYLSYTMGLFGLATLLSIAGLIWTCFVLLIIVSVLFLFGLAILLVASYIIASTARSVI